MFTHAKTHGNNDQRYMSYNSQQQLFASESSTDVLASVQESMASVVEATRKQKAAQKELEEKMAAARTALVERRNRVMRQSEQIETEHSFLKLRWTELDEQKKALEVEMHACWNAKTRNRLCAKRLECIRKALDENIAVLQTNNSNETSPKQSVVSSKKSTTNELSPCGNAVDLDEITADYDCLLRLEQNNCGEFDEEIATPKCLRSDSKEAPIPFAISCDELLNPDLLSIATALTNEEVDSFSSTSTELSDDIDQMSSISYITTYPDGNANDFDFARFDQNSTLATITGISHTNSYESTVTPCIANSFENVAALAKELSKSTEKLDEAKESTSACDETCCMVHTTQEVPDLSKAELCCDSVEDLSKIPDIFGENIVQIQICSDSVEDLSKIPDVFADNVVQLPSWTPWKGVDSFLPPLSLNSSSLLDVRSSSPNVVVRESYSAPAFRIWRSPPKPSTGNTSDERSHSNSA